MEEFYEMIDKLIKQFGFDYDNEKVKALATFLEVDEEEVSTFVENLEEMGCEYYYEGDTFVVMTEEEFYAEMNSYRDTIVDDVKWRIPQDLRDYFDYDTYAGDAVGDECDMWDVISSDLVSVNKTFYKVIQIRD